MTPVGSAAGDAPRVAMVTYSTRPRGGVVHALHLAEALHGMGQPVHLFALGEPDQGLHRPSAVPHTIIPAPAPAPTLEERVFRNVDVLAEALKALVPGRFDIVHTQDCIAARAATRLRDGGLPVVVMRTVHHVDDFTTQALIDCQRRSILEPDHVLVVSEYWRRVLREEYGVQATVVTNGVDTARFSRNSEILKTALRTRIGAEGRFLFLTVGGFEPRKGSLELVEAMARLRSSLSPTAILAVVGGESFQDHKPYRDRVHARAAALQLEMGRDVVLVGTVPDLEMPSWYHCADAFVFPSVREGWGLAVLEALAAGLPVVATDIPVFREYLTDGKSALLVPPGDAGALAEAMLHVATDRDLREALAKASPAVAGRFTWEACANQHVQVYRRLLLAWRHRGEDLVDAQDRLI